MTSDTLEIPNSSQNFDANFKSNILKDLSVVVSTRSILPPSSRSSHFPVSCPTIAPPPILRKRNIPNNQPTNHKHPSASTLGDGSSINQKSITAPTQIVNSLVVINDAPKTVRFEMELNSKAIVDNWKILNKANSFKGAQQQKGCCCSIF